VFRRVRRVVRTKVGRLELVVRGVELDECPVCGERLYDLAVLARIREVRERASRTGAA
jgi:YgiT-type zinc finger domain-containing protein